MFSMFLIYVFSCQQILCFLLKFRPFTDLASSKYAAVKPDKPPQGRAARPLATLSQICVKNSLSPSSTGKNDKCDEADVTGKHSATEEQVII